MFVVSCSAGTPENGQNIGGSKASISFFIKYSKAEKEAFLSKLSIVSIGSSWSEVKKILGGPDIEAPVARKETPEEIGTIRVYYLTKVSEGLVNKKLDQSVTLFFDLEDKLVRVDVSPSLTKQDSK